MGHRLHTVTEIARYWRPQTLDQAFTLLERPAAVVLGGGTGRGAGAPHGEAAVEVVDLQALGLDGLDPCGDGALRIGAFARLQQLVDAEQVPAIVREAARRELPSTLRAQATLGGCVVRGAADSELLAALLVHDARVTVASRCGEEDLGLGAVLGRRPLGTGRIVLAVTIDTRGHAALDRVARTRADRPIVAAAARVFEGQRIVALAGVGPTPVLVDPSGTGPGAGIDPEGDFRGSSGYRRAIAGVLVGRVLEVASR